MTVSVLFLSCLGDFGVVETGNPKRISIVGFTLSIVYITVLADQLSIRHAVCMCKAMAISDKPYGEASTLATLQRLQDTLYQLCG